MKKKKIHKISTWLPLMMCLLASSAFANSNNCTIQSVITRPNDYLNKTVTLTGKIERMVGTDSFVMSANGDSTQRILVMTSAPSNAGANPALNDRKQNAGIAGNQTSDASRLKDNLKIQVTGTVDLMNVKSETDSFNPQQDTASFTQVTTHTPIVVVRPDQIHLQ